MSYNSFLPNILLINQDGAEHRFHDILGNGKVILFNMFYATCAVKCVPTGANMVRINKLLSQLMIEKDIHFVSITLDSKNDDTNKLKSYINKINAEDCINWNFYTGNYNEIEDLRFKLCMNIEDDMELDKDISIHRSDSLIINNKMGQVRHFYSFENPINIARRLLQLCSSNLGKQNGCFFLKDLDYDKVPDDELFENLLSMSDRYTIPYLPKNVLIKLDKHARKEKENNFNYYPLEIYNNRQKQSGNNLTTKSCISCPCSRKNTDLN